MANKNKTSQLPVEVGAVVPKPPNVEPPKPGAADVVAALKPPNAGAGAADVAGAPKPTIVKFNRIIQLIFAFDKAKKIMNHLFSCVYPLLRMYFVRIPMVHRNPVVVLLLVPQMLAVLMWSVH